MFSFFFQVTRKNITTFCGSDVENRNRIVFDPSGDDAKFCFRKIENGQYKPGEEIRTRHPNILKNVLTGKSGWGLWLNEWASGISEGSFTKYEILKEFEDKKIEIPRSLFIDFENRIYSFMQKKIKFH